MHSITILSLVLLLNSIQNIDATQTNYEINSNEAINNNSELLLSSQRDRDLRSIKEIWNNMRNSLVKAWNFVKKLADNTKQKLNTWNQNVKKRAQDLTVQFQNHMRRLKQKLNDIIKKTFGNSQVVKMCLEKDRPEMDKIINNIITQFSACITHHTKKPSFLSIKSLDVNDTNFSGNLEKRFTQCQRDLDNAEECLNKVNQDKFNEMEDRERDILKTRTEARNIVDNLLEDLVTCSIQGLLKATSTVTLRAVEITKCILKPQ